MEHPANHPAAAVAALRAGLDVATLAALAERDYLAGERAILGRRA